MNLQLESLTFPLRVRPSVPLTDTELEKFSEGNRPYRIERNKQGELVIMTPINTEGGKHEFYIAGMLAAWTEEDGTGVGFSSATGFTLPDGSILSPDASWIPNVSYEGLTAEQRGSYAPICPAFIIEVRSKPDSRRMVEAKMQTWVENGAQLAWLIDPLDATVSIYRPGQPTEILERPDLVLGHPPVEGFQLKTTRLWPER